MPARKYSDEELNQAAEMRERGLSFRQIGHKLGMSPSAVSWHCLRLGADSPNTLGRIDTPKGPMVVSRLGHTVRRFSDAEDERMLAMEADGARVCDMARALDRTPQSIRGRLMTLARREARMEAADA